MEVVELDSDLKYELHRTSEELLDKKLAIDENDRFREEALHDLEAVLDKIENKKITKDLDESDELKNQSETGNISCGNASLAEVKETRKLIHRYLTNNRFRSFLKEQGFSKSREKLESMTAEQLKDLLHKIQLSVQNRTSNLTSEFVFEILNGLEYVCVTFTADKIKIKGLSKALQEDESFLDALEEIHLLWVTDKLSSPYERVAWTVFTTAMKTHALNSAGSMIINRINKPTGDLSPTFQPINTSDPRVVRFAEQPSLITPSEQE